MIQLLVRHKIEDFAKWKRVFDAHAKAQRDAGLRAKQVLRNVDDPNELILVFDVDDLDKARRFVTAPDVTAAKNEAGVVDQPDVYFVQ